MCRLTFLLTVAALLTACGAHPPPRKTQSPSQPASLETLARGEYLARVGDCVACHTAPGGKEYVGGRAFVLHMGTLYSPNITPDRATGIGAWTDDDFVTAMQKGIAPNGTHYYPAFPYNYFTRLSRDDILAIKAYLFTLKPIASQEPQSALRFPFSQRWLMVFWNALYNSDERFKPDPKQSAEWNRGAFLTEGPAHCGACHTPMNFLQGPKSGHALAGESLQGWHAYNITSDLESGVGKWTNEELVSYLSTGHANGRGTASGPMAEAISYSLSHVKREDLQAIAAYLKTVKPVRGKVVPAKKQNSNPLGERIYAGACAGCHGWDGKGMQNPYASLQGSRSLSDPKGTNLTQVIFEGTRLDTPHGEVFMPAFRAGYSDVEIAALANFVSQRFGRGSNVSADQVYFQWKRQQPRKPGDE
jgi:mono/diheme cytochrome c family protein